MSDHVFPQPELYSTFKKDYAKPGTQCGGLTRRELFAAMAMQSIMEAHIRHPMPFDAPWFHHLSEQSVRCADALIAELAKGGE